MKRWFRQCSRSETVAPSRVAARFADERYQMASTVRFSWLVPKHRETRLWSEHQDINDVMLATALVPVGFLSIRRTESEV